MWYLYIDFCELGSLRYDRGKLRRLHKLEFTNFHLFPRLEVIVQNFVKRKFSEKLTQMLRELMEKIAENQEVMVGMYNLEQGARVIEARLQPIKTPDFRYFK